jgi:hypothetical protein
MSYILWDIDGVLNPFMATDLVERGFVRFNRDWISWDLDIVHHAEWMRQLDEQNKFVWASTWGDESNALCGWFHLKELSYPHIPLQMNSNHDGTWKLASVSTWVEQNVPRTEKIVWVEDELHEDAYRWAENRGNVLLVKTDDSVGFTEQQYENVVAFLQN